MTTCLGNGCSFGLLCVSFVNVYQYCRVCFLSSLGVCFEGGMRDLTVLIPDHCLFFLFMIWKVVHDPIYFSNLFMQNSMTFFFFFLLKFFYSRPN